MQNVSHLIILAVLVTLSHTMMAIQPSPPFENIQCEGASNTAGATASFSFCLHLKSKLIGLELAKREKLESKKTLIGFDYFYPSNFNDFYLQKDQVMVAAKKRVEELLENKGYEIVVLGEVPNIEGFDGRLLAEIPASGGFKNVIEGITEVDNGHLKALMLNNLLRSLAKSEKYKGRLFIMSFKGLFESFLQSRQFEEEINSAPLLPTQLWADPIHLSDIGQLFVMNEWVLPALELALKVGLGKLKYEGIGDGKKRKILAPFVGNSQEFKQGVEADYWAELESNESVYMSRGVLRVPGREPVVVGEFETINEFFHQLPPRQKVALQHLYGIAALMEYKAKNSDVDGLFVSLPKGSENQKLILDLEKVLYYVKITLDPLSIGTYEAFGYDKWSSYSWLRWFDKGAFTKLRKNWGATDFGVASDPPWVNYHFTVKKDPDTAGRMVVQMVIYPRMEISNRMQPLGEKRLPFISEPWLAELKNNYKNYPSLTYEIPIQVQDLN